MTTINIDTKLFKDFDIVINDTVYTNTTDTSFLLDLPQPQELQIKHKFFRSNTLTVDNHDVVKLVLNPWGIIIPTIVIALMCYDTMFIPLVSCLLAPLNFLLKLTKQ